MTRDAPAFHLAWVNSLLHLITSGITLEQFLRRIHEEFDFRYRIDVMEVFGYDHEGHLSRRFSFGTCSDGPALRLTRDELHPITDCVRTEDVLAIVDQREYQMRYPALARGNGPSLFIPLRYGPLVDGIFAITFAKQQRIEWHQEPQLQEALVTVANLAHLIMMKSSHAHDLASEGSVSDATLGLSDRQLLIARMIAQGMTNRSIARELGFSEATIRYETIKLYERLRVKNRSHAAARIHQLGIA